MPSRIGTQGEVREFELFDQKYHYGEGKRFVAIAEYLEKYTVEGTDKVISGFVSQCFACHSLRCLLVNEKDKSWTCLKCNRKGTFKKPEKGKESRESKRKKVMNNLAGRKKRY